MNEKVKVIKIRENSRETADDFVIREVPLTLIVDNEELVTLLCSPSDFDELARGFLFTSGLIKKDNDISKIIINQEQWSVFVDLADASLTKGLVFKRLYTSGCGRGVLFYNTQDLIGRYRIISELKVQAAKINELMAEFQDRSEGYLRTGGAHSAALSDGSSIIIFKEDIGRHNAIDKVIGRALKEGIVFKDKIILTSGRISSEVIFKTQKSGAPVLVSKSAPTNQAIKLAKELGVTLVGFARGKRMNVYSHAERIV